MPRNPKKPGPGAWQNQPDRGAQGRVTSPEQYLDHPKDASGRNICYAKISGKNKHCQLDAGRGTGHFGYGACSLHGGNTPTLETNGARKAGGEIIMKMAKGYGMPVKIDPHQALLDEVARCAGHVAFLKDRIDFFELELGTQVLVPAMEQLIEMYRQERLMLTKAAKMAIDAGIAEQRVAMERAKGMLLVDVLKEVFGGLQLTVEQQRLLPTLVPAALRRLTEPGLTLSDEPLQLPGG